MRHVKRNKHQMHDVSDRVSEPRIRSVRPSYQTLRQHYVVPEPILVSDITHVALAFMQSSIFNTPGWSEWPLFTSVEAVRSQFPDTTAILVAIGGWGDTQGFSDAAATEGSRRLFARNVKAMIERTGADGSP